MEQPVVLRKAVVADAPQILALVNFYARRSEVLPRRPTQVYQGIREWVVAEQGGEIVGCGALEILWADLAEIRSLVVKPERHGGGLGGQIVEMLIDEARALGIGHVFTLTRAVGFFARHEFALSAKENFPSKIWKDCLRCPLRENCDEVAMVRPLAGERALPGEAPHARRTLAGLEVAA
jgi:amino-acid N-acetyltransferase